MPFLLSVKQDPEDAVKEEPEDDDDDWWDPNDEPFFREAVKEEEEVDDDHREHQKKTEPQTSTKPIRSETQATLNAAFDEYV